MFCQHVPHKGHLSQHKVQFYWSLNASTHSHLITFGNVMTFGLSNISSKLGGSNSERREFSSFLVHSCHFIGQTWQVWHRSWILGPKKEIWWLNLSFHLHLKVQHESCEKQGKYNNTMTHLNYHYDILGLTNF
jgi:hypothetical protein